MRKYYLVSVFLLVIGAALGSLWATTSTTTVAATATGTATSGGNVTAWTTDAAKPEWFPVKGAVGIIDANHNDEDCDGGQGLSKVPPVRHVSGDCNDG